MSALRFVLICSLSVFFFSQLVLSRPDAPVEEGSLKSVEAKVSVAFDDLKNAMSDIMKNITDAIQTEMAKHPDATAMYKNFTDGIMKQVNDAVASVTPKP